jgi:NCAIR mutase (PurE)-related protein
MLAVLEHGCREVLNWNGVSRERPITGLGVAGSHRLLELFHFKVEKVMTYRADDAFLDGMQASHVVTGEELTLYILAGS